MNELTINLWIFPEADFAAWCELVGTPEVGSFAGYMTLLAAIQADQEHSGRSIRRVQMTVAEMIAGLAANNWPNEEKYRAAVIATQN